MLIVLVFLSSLHLTLGRQPTCPNGQQPKLNANGGLLQCLPGSSTCGPDYLCFFSGMNYMCCPSNEPSPANQPRCPLTSLTALDSHGLPLKCSPRTRMCPQESMTCSDVGLAFICCEKPMSSLGSSVSTTTTGNVRKYRKTRPARPVIECPANSLGVLSDKGRPVVCDSKRKCSQYGQFCHAEKGVSICCEKYEFAASSHERARPSEKTPSSFLEVAMPVKTKRVNIVVNPSGVTRTSQTPTTPVQALPQSMEHQSIRTQVQTPSGRLNDGSVKRISKQKITSTTESPPTTDVSSSTRPIVVFSSTQTTTTKKKRARVHAVRTHVRTVSDGFPKSQSSVTLQPLQEKQRAMAHQFLLNKIRNGWPYDDRFYRPDTGAPQPTRETDVARLRFINN